MCERARERDRERDRQINREEGRGRELIKERIDNIAAEEEHEHNRRFHIVSNINRIMIGRAEVANTTTSGWNMKTYKLHELFKPIFNISKIYTNTLLNT